ncbi:MAG: hypothetical protein RMJ36_00730 [Candidatus Calescibacterium sp.]|nr:hypothetical protein [Candidatus Calescibacterium sp.]MDW8132168.1 hypothetical protein [Candidatus Calescibacterium sp.]
MPRKKQKHDDKNTLKNKKNSSENNGNDHDIIESIENKEQVIEFNDEDELNIDSLTDLDDLEELEDEYTEMEDSNFFISEDDLIICPSCGEVIEIERLKMLEECPSCGLNISEFEEIDRYDSIFKERDEEDEW